jgi:hypothetical protein
MRFLVDECTWPSVDRWLRDHDYEVFQYLMKQEVLTMKTLL